MRNILRAAAAAFMALSLSGCFVSETPLITPDNADQPFKTAMQFSRTELANPAKVSDAELAPEDKGYTLREGTKPPAELMFKSIGGGFYIAQQTTKSNTGEVRYIFGLVRIDGRTIYSYYPECSRPRDTKFLRSGAIATMEGDGENPTCHVANLANLIKILKTRHDDEPQARYVPL